MIKKFFLTWYGITDLNAALGWEQTTGPVLNALLQEYYTDVIILAPTMNKSVIDWDVLHQQIANLDEKDRTARQLLIDRLANTVVAHQYFNHWLTKQLQKAGKKANLRFRPVKISHLNDTESIYEAAIQSLNEAASSQAEKLVTLYLSPGTPVMALVWAFASLKYSDLKKRLIASSRPGHPPEVINLPNEWLEWHGKQIGIGHSENDHYDVIFHLFGEQGLPNLLGVRQFISKKHVFINSVDFPADIMKQFIKQDQYDEITVDPYNPKNVRSMILDYVEKIPADAKIGFNLTGGTKLMYAGALSACRKINATPFYFELGSYKVINLNDFSKQRIKPIDSVDTIVRVNSRKVSISDQGKKTFSSKLEEENYYILTELLWNNRNSSKPWQWIEQQKAVQFTDKDGVKRFIQFKSKKHWEQYQSGHWLEDYVFLRLKPLMEKGLIKDLRSEMKLCYDDIKVGSQYQEIDVLFTEGRKLYIIECKSSSISGDDLSKLSAVTREFGGINGQGILFTCKPSPNPMMAQKAKNLKLILSSDNHLFEQLEATLQQARTMNTGKD